MFSLNYYEMSKCVENAVFHECLTLKVKDPFIKVSVPENQRRKLREIASKFCVGIPEQFPNYSCIVLYLKGGGKVAFEFIGSNLLIGTDVAVRPTEESAADCRCWICNLPEE